MSEPKDSVRGLVRHVKREIDAPPQAAASIEATISELAVVGVKFEAVAAGAKADGNDDLADRCKHLARGIARTVEEMRRDLFGQPHPDEAAADGE